MDQVRFDYSTKNILIPPRNSYFKSLIEKVESVIKRMRWKAFIFDRNEQDNNYAIHNDNFGFKSRKKKSLVNPVPFSGTVITVLSPLGALVFFKDYANSSHFCFLFRGVSL